MIEPIRWHGRRNNEGVRRRKSGILNVENGSAGLFCNGVEKMRCDGQLRDRIYRRTQASQFAADRVYTSVFQLSRQRIVVNPAAIVAISDIGTKSHYLRNNGNIEDTLLHIVK